MGNVQSHNLGSEDAQDGNIDLVYVQYHFASSNAIHVDDSKTR